MKFFYESPDGEKVTVNMAKEELAYLYKEGVDLGFLAANPSTQETEEEEEVQAVKDFLNEVEERLNNDLFNEHFEKAINPSIKDDRKVKFHIRTKGTFVPDTSNKIIGWLIANHLDYTEGTGHRAEYSEFDLTVSQMFDLIDFLLKIDSGYTHGFYIS